MAIMEHRDRLVSRNNRRTVLRDSEKRAARTIVRLHYSFLCLSIGFILGAWNYYNQFTEIRSTVVIATGGLLTAGYLGARSEERDHEYLKAQVAQKAQETEEAKASYHIHYGPLGIIEHANDHNPDYDHGYGTFPYDYERYEF